MSEPIPASEFSRNFGRYTDKAIADGVVEVSSNGRLIGAFLSEREYERYRELRRRGAKTYSMTDLPTDLRGALDRGLDETERRIKARSKGGPAT